LFSPLVSYRHQCPGHKPFSRTYICLDFFENLPAQNQNKHCLENIVKAMQVLVGYLSKGDAKERKDHFSLLISGSYDADSRGCTCVSKKTIHFDTGETAS
jgi:hypothetical protein